MTPQAPQRREDSEESNPEWFRPLTRREHYIGGALFLGFGVFFVLLFIVSAGFWFRWVVLFMAMFSFIKGMRHAAGARRAGREGSGGSPS